MTRQFLFDVHAISDAVVMTVYSTLFLCSDFGPRSPCCVPMTCTPRPAPAPPPRAQGMRIDYFLLSTVLASQIAGVEVFGRGKDREGFLGSDHSPVMLTLGEVGQRDPPSGCGGTGISEGLGEMQEGVGGVEGGNEVGDAGGGGA